MTNYKLKGSFDAVKYNKIGIKVINDATRNIKLQPLSMDAYVFTPKKIDKKRRVVQNTIKEAEKLMSAELGRPLAKKRRKRLIEIKK